MEMGGLGDRGGDDRGARAGTYGHRGARGRARDASDARGGRGAARGARDPAFLNFGRGRTFRKTVFLPEAREGRQGREGDASRRLVERIHIYKSVLVR